MSPAVSKARTPKLPRTAWPGSGVFVCLVDRAKSSQTVLTFDIQQTISTSELPLANRAYQSITTCQYSMSLDMILTAGERGPSRSLNVGCAILCQP